MVDRLHSARGEAMSTKGHLAVACETIRLLLAARHHDRPGCSCRPLPGAEWRMVLCEVCQQDTNDTSLDGYDMLWLRVDDGADVSE